MGSHGASRACEQKMRCVGLGGGFVSVSSGWLVVVDLAFSDCHSVTGSGGDVSRCNCFIFCLCPVSVCFIYFSLLLHLHTLRIFIS